MLSICIHMYPCGFRHEDGDKKDKDLPCSCTSLHHHAQIVVACNVLDDMAIDSILVCDAIPILTFLHHFHTLIQKLLECTRCQFPVSTRFSNIDITKLSAGIFQRDCGAFVKMVGREEFVLHSCRVSYLRLEAKVLAYVRIHEELRGGVVGQSHSGYVHICIQLDNICSS